MRLLVISQYFWPEIFRVNDLVKNLVQRGHQVTVLTGTPNYPSGSVFQEYKIDPNKYSNFEGAEIVRVPMSPRGRGGMQLLMNYLTFAISGTVVGLWKLRRRKFDVIFTCQFSPVTVGIPAIAARAIKGIPMIFWIQDLWPDSLRAVGAVKSELALRMVGRLVSFIYNRCDLILTQSRGFIPQVRKYAPVSTRIIYFPNWSDIVFQMDEIVPAPEVPVLPGVFNVVFAGNIGDAQDFPSILSAAECLRSYCNIRWLILGEGSMSEWVRSEIERLNLQSHVVMMGWFPPDRMGSFFKHADALLVCLKNDPIFSMTVPSKLQTYLAAGLPILTMLNGEGSQVVGDANAGLTVESGDYVALAAAVLKLSQASVSDRRQMGLNGCVVSVRDFGREGLIDRLEGYFQEFTPNASKDLP